ncbi:probable serine/threonine-protein kinase PBL26 [Helianthus annuus]|uniref:probable serine/threonine-protein kinase PBL26 n=1 Tax=Helianthus annuus TaxID=4232 RepID=UPI000B8FB0DF|nr:probable serine/threonine-protein kinase PBL26 [Helianthus annuus]
MGRYHPQEESLIFFMDTFLQQFQDLKIQLEDITSATDNFNDDKCIGGGGFGKVYKGEVSHSKGRITVAFERLDPRHGQGIPEFLKEITTLSGYHHENLISLSLLGFCYQGDEMILGLRYLHDPRGTHQRLIHCDVKSANILLNAQWNGKLADFGLSIMGPANEKQSIIVTMAAGTIGYCDPQSWAMLTESWREYRTGIVEDVGRVEMAQR